MDTNKIAIFNKIIMDHNQYGDDSMLHHCVKSVWNVSYNKSKRLAKSYCNVISFYAVLFASGHTKDSLYEFMMYCKETKWNDPRNKRNKKLLDRDGYLRGKKQICNHYGFNLNGLYFYNYGFVENDDSLDPKYFYQMKRRQRFHLKRSHFIGCYTEDGILYMSCSAKDGIAVQAKKKVSKKLFKWVLLIG